ncbi:MAG: hypothetical protein NZ898_13340 [Myxococcota bacterium]|nr:hypothetical protein [Myxococcota bacterium]MDW8364148.1 hypothetical protein [Myxococcales bacterium]
MALVPPHPSDLSSRIARAWASRGRIPRIFETQRPAWQNAAAPRALRRAVHEVRASWGWLRPRWTHRVR